MSTPTDNLPRLLLTGFTPFGEHTVNPSWQLAQRLDGETINRTQIVTGQLPVDWTAAWPALAALLDSHAPVWLLMMGVAGTRQAVSVETRARNVTTPVRDTNELMPPVHDQVVEGGREYLPTTLPAPLLVEQFHLVGIPAQISTDAGSFLCNWSLYHALADAGRRPGLRGVGFIHLPPLPQDGSADANLDLWARGLRRAIGRFAGQ